MQSMPIFALLLVAVVARSSLATRGVDVSQAVSKDAFDCIQKAGYSFAIVRIYQSNDKVDVNAAQTIKNARAAGIKNVDGYIFPCKKCGDPRRQVKTALDDLEKKGAKINQLWLDVEGVQYWGGNNDADNIKFIQGMVDEANAQKVKVAMYTSHSQWQPITGNSKAFQGLQLWYAHYDGQQNFNDFKPFGGWEKPAIKQYKGTTPLCGVSVDLNWYP